MEALDAYRRRQRAMPRPQRIARVAKKLAARHIKRTDGRRRPMRQVTKKPRVKPMIAYDLETTRIESGTPRPLYITAHGATFRLSRAVKNIEHLAEILRTDFLTEENKGARFVAWNGNSFDAFFIARALLTIPEVKIQPYMTRSKSLRGMKVSINGERGQWEFLDGIAMIMGGAKRKLKDFLKTFAPDYGKLDAPDWENETFDAGNPQHVAYAERDSEGLFHGMQRAQDIVMEHFGQPLQPTIGNLGIRLFQQMLPADVIVWAPGARADAIIREHVLRGGYCFHNQRYAGPTWKYDINQAYAAAMRDARLPSGSLLRTFTRPRGVYIARVQGALPFNMVPFYCAREDGKKEFARDQIDSWITSIEVEQLRSEGYALKIVDSYSWSASFSQRDMVDTLERLRIHAPGGPKSAQGEMMKALGNNAYGKTVEQLDGMELVMSVTRPDGFSEYREPTGELDYIWFKLGTPQMREYHQPQIGSFITAHVRMVLRRAILNNPKAWIYSDTDSVAFSAPVQLDIDPGRYGAWKIECEAKDYQFIGKKIYCAADGSEMKWKGLSTRGLTIEDFNRAFNGESVEQDQLQRVNFMQVMEGREMYRQLHKWGMKNEYTARIDRERKEQRANLPVRSDGDNQLSRHRRAA